MKKKQIKEDLIDLEINLEVLIAEKKENKKQTVRLNSRISELKSKLEIKECGYYIQYADGTTGKIGQPKKFKSMCPLLKYSTPLVYSELPRREDHKVIDNKLDKKRQKIDRKRHEAFLEIKNNTTSAIKKVFEPSSQKTKECLDYYDDWLKQMKDSITKVNKCKNEWEKVIKKWLPIGIVNSDIPDLKIDEHKNRVCSELAEKSPFHINDFENEYDKLKWHFLENKLKGRLQSIAEFAASSGLGMSLVGNFLIENKSTS